MFAATTISVNGTAPVLIVPGSPVGSKKRQALIQNTGIVASSFTTFYGGTSFVGSAGFPMTATIPLSVEAGRQQDLYGAGHKDGASQAITVLMDLI